MESANWRGARGSVDRVTVRTAEPRTLFHKVAKVLRAGSPPASTTSHRDHDGIRPGTSLHRPGPLPRSAVLALCALHTPHHQKINTTYCTESFASLLFSPFALEKIKKTLRAFICLRPRLRKPTRRACYATCEVHTYLLLGICSLSCTSRSRRCSSRRSRRGLLRGPDLLRLGRGGGDGREALLLGPLPALPLGGRRCASADRFEHEAGEVLPCVASEDKRTGDGRGQGRREMMINPDCDMVSRRKEGVSGARGLDCDVLYIPTSTY